MNELTVRLHEEMKDFAKKTWKIMGWKGKIREMSMDTVFARPFSCPGIG